MNDNSRMKPNADFPEDLEQLTASEVEILNSKIHRQLDYEYVQEGEPDPETAGRHEELTAELNRRDRDTLERRDRTQPTHRKHPLRRLQVPGTWYPAAAIEGRAGNGQPVCAAGICC